MYIYLQYKTTYEKSCTYLNKVQNRSYKIVTTIPVKPTYLHATWVLVIATMNNPQYKKNKNTKNRNKHGQKESRHMCIQII